jgi:hypothetical protein
MPFDIIGLILTVAGGVILLLLGIIGVFLKSLITAIDNLKTAVNNLRLLVELIKSENKAASKLCDLKHADIDKRLLYIEDFNCDHHKK